MKYGNTVWCTDLTKDTAQLPCRVHLQLLSGCNDGIRLYPDVRGHTTLSGDESLLTSDQK